MIKIQFNGQDIQLENSITLNDFLHQQKISFGCMAVAINHSFIPKSHYNETWICCGDRIECVVPMQGG